MSLKLGLRVGVVYFAIATYGGSYYAGPAMIFALSLWLYKLQKKDNTPKSK
jgi:hypothetical protein